MTDAARHAAGLLGGSLHRAEAMHGGDLSQVVRITLTDGRVAVVKGGPAPRSEAAMLTCLRDAGMPAPAVLAVSESVLVLEALEAQGGISDAWSDLGAVLSRLHANEGAHYGWASDYAFGPVTIENAVCNDWPAFWADRRLRVHLPHIPAALARRVDALARDLPNRLPLRPPPALLHGDLWGGNVLVAAGKVVGLIDPACYYGHAEVDLAMLGLFDHPSHAFFEAYAPLAPGCAARSAIYRLWPALVHLRLFGAGYRSLVEGFLASAGV